MAHSHERTLLASLGFSDRDRRERRHTWACQYLARPDVAMKVAAHLEPGWAAPIPERVAVTARTSKDAPDTGGVCGLRFGSAETEVPILRGRDHLVGFWDVRVKFKATLPAWREAGAAYAPGEAVEAMDRAAGLFGGTWSMLAGRSPLAPPKPRDVCVGVRHEPVDYPTSREMFVEVKASPVDVGDVAKQMALYMQFTAERADALFVVATCYAMPRSDRETLAAKGVRHIWLGDGFDAYCETRRAEGLDVAGGGL